MKQLYSLIICLGVISNCYSQKFNLTSNNFQNGDIFTTYLIYDLDKWDIREENKLVLDSLAILIKKNPNLLIEVGTHTNKINLEYSMRFDFRRSKSVVEYLISKGVPIVQLIPKGYGDTKPLIEENDIDKMITEEEKMEAWAMNHRTEFKVLKTDFQEHLK